MKGKPKVKRVNKLVEKLNVKKLGIDITQDKQEVVDKMKVILKKINNDEKQVEETIEFLFLLAQEFKTILLNHDEQ